MACEKCGNECTCGSGAQHDNCACDNKESCSCVGQCDCNNKDKCSCPGSGTCDCDKSADTCSCAKKG